MALLFPGTEDPGIWWPLSSDTQLGTPECVSLHLPLSHCVSAPLAQIKSNLKLTLSNIKHLVLLHYWIENEFFLVRECQIWTEDQ